VSRKKTEHRLGSNFSSRTVGPSAARALVPKREALRPTRRDPGSRRQGSNREVPAADRFFVEGPHGVAPVARPRARSAPVRNALARAVACAETQVSALGMVAVGFQRANKRSGFDTGSPGALALVNDRPVRPGRFAASRVSPSLALGTLETPALPRCALRLRVAPCRAAARASLSRSRTVLSPSRFHAAATAAARDRAPICLVFFRREQCVGSARKGQTL
jgi:hypothetical protein